MKEILLVEDDPQITSLLSLHLHEPFYRVTACDRGLAALEKLDGGAFHLVILDIMLPDLSGVEICRRIRERNEQTPILMLSSLAEETDKVTALELGADDYLTKPFGVFELMARVKALMRRGNEAVTGGSGETGERVAGKGLLVRGELVIDKDKKRVTIRGQRLELTPKEFDLLVLMASHPGKTFTRHELLEKIWGFAFQEYEHTVTSHINRLRIKLEKNLNKPEYILTTWGTGYRFAE
ncbi:MAG TPA: response regulator transcription factor [Puia sp.]|jgi:DNA-binding response OmpR family regulator|nr:response regulator transcription factor [Puia sp.]